MWRPLDDPAAMATASRQLNDFGSNLGFRFDLAPGMYKQLDDSWKAGSNRNDALLLANYAQLLVQGAADAVWNRAAKNSSGAAPDYLAQYSNLLRATLVQVDEQARTLAAAQSSYDEIETKTRFAEPHHRELTMATATVALDTAKLDVITANQDSERVFKEKLAVIAKGLQGSVGQASAMPAAPTLAPPGPSTVLNVDPIKLADVGDTYEQQGTAMQEINSTFGITKLPAPKEPSIAGPFQELAGALDRRVAAAATEYLHLANALRGSAQAYSGSDGDADKAFDEALVAPVGN